MAILRACRAREAVTSRARQAGARSDTGTDLRSAVLPGGAAVAAHRVSEAADTGIGTSDGAVIFSITQDGGNRLLPVSRQRASSRLPAKPRAVSRRWPSVSAANASRSAISERAATSSTRVLSRCKQSGSGPASANERLTYVRPTTDRHSHTFALDRIKCYRSLNRGPNSSNPTPSPWQETASHFGARGADDGERTSQQVADRGTTLQPTRPSTL